MTVPLLLDLLVFAMFAGGLTLAWYAGSRKYANPPTENIVIPWPALAAIGGGFAALAVACDVVNGLSSASGQLSAVGALIYAAAAFSRGIFDWSAAIGALAVLILLFLAEQTRALIHHDQVGVYVFGALAFVAFSEVAGRGKFELDPFVGAIAGAALALTGIGALLIAAESAVAGGIALLVVGLLLAVYFVCIVMCETQSPPMPEFGPGGPLPPCSMCGDFGVISRYNDMPAPCECRL